MVVEDVVKVSCVVDVSRTPCYAEIEAIVRSKRGNEWRVDWVRWLNTQKAYCTPDSMPTSVIHIPIYKFTHESVEHE